MSVAFPFRVYGENGCAVEGWRHERNPFFFSFCGVDDLQLHCQDITDTTPYSCGRRKFSLACSHAQRPRNYHANTCTKVNEREGGLLTKLWL